MDISSLGLSQESGLLKVEVPDLPEGSLVTPDKYVVNSYSASQSILVSCPTGVDQVAVTSPPSALGTYSCVAGKAAIPFDISVLAEGTYLFEVEVPGNSAIPRASISVLKDTLPPTAALDVSILAYANKYNQLTYSVFGTCSDQGGLVVISATSLVDATLKVSKNLLCAAGLNFTSDLNLNTLPEGAFTVSVKHYDLAGNYVVDSFSRQKDITDAAVPVLAVVPTGTTALTSYSTTVSGTDVVSYRYKVGLQSSTNCAVDTGYSGSAPVATPLTSNLTVFGNAPLRLCVLSVDVAGNVLALGSAFQADWIRDTTAVNVLLSDFSPTGNISNQTGARTVTPSGSGVTHYKSAVITSGTCAAVDFTAISEVAVATPITVNASGAGTYQVCALGRNSGGDWQVTPTSSAVLTIDLVAPTVTLSSSTSATTNTTPIPVTATFSESVTGFAVGDITATNGTISNFSGSGAVYTFDVTPTADGVVTVGVAANVAQDAAGNDNTAATSLTRTYDSQPPSVVISSSTTSPTNGSFPVTVTFNESVTGFVAGDIVVANGTISGFAGSGTTYTFTLNPSVMTTGTITISVPSSVAQDGVGNGNTASALFSMSYDSVAPTVSIVADSAANTNVSPVTFTATFSKAISGFIAGDLTVVNGTASLSGTGPYTISVVPTTSGTVSVKLNASSVQDAAGNVNAADSAVVGVMYDIVVPVPPTVTNLTYTTSSGSAPAASWSGATDGHSGIASYEIAIGTTSGGSNVKTWANVGTATSNTVSGLTLSVGTMYYVSLRVIDNAGNTNSAVSGSAFRYLTTPTISAVAPTSGTAAGGTTITLTGTGFYGAMTATVGGASCGTLTVVSSTSITCVTPSGTAGAKDIVLTNAASQSATLASSYTYTASSSVATFTNTGADQNFVVPAGVTSIQIKAWGAGGTVTGSGTGQGGGGAYATGTLAVTPGETLKIIVGGHNGYGGGDQSGGGRSAVRRSTTELITAGGGGGGSFGTNTNGGAAGDASTAASNGAVDASFGGNAHGKGATTSAGGAGGIANCTGYDYPTGGSAGTQFQGGANGGGGGYYGGGGGAGCGTYIGGAPNYIGAGGGSSYIGGVTGGSSAAGVGLGAGNASDTARTGSIEPQAGDSSRPGLVLISY